MNLEESQKMQGTYGKTHFNLISLFRELRKYCIHKTRTKYYVKGVENKKELLEIKCDYWNSNFNRNIER